VRGAAFNRCSEPVIGPTAGALAPDVFAEDAETAAKRASPAWEVIAGMTYVGPALGPPATGVAKVVTPAVGRESALTAGPGVAGTLPALRSEDSASRLNGEESALGLNGSEFEESRRVLKAGVAAEPPADLSLAGGISDNRSVGVKIAANEWGREVCTSSERAMRAGGGGGGDGSGRGCAYPEH